METERRNKIITRIYNISRAIILIVFLSSLLLWATTAEAAEREDWIPAIHGTVRGKFEYQPSLQATRFEVRNARVSVDGQIPFGHNDTIGSFVLKRGVRYKAEIDLSDEGAIKMLDAYVQVRPFRSLHFTIGQMRVPFSIDAHRSPHQQYFANRSFIAKQVGNVRDVGLMTGYTWYYPTSKSPLKRGGSEGGSRPFVMLDAGLFNGSGLTAQKTAWHRDINFSARAQFFPLKPWNITLSSQRSRVGADSLHYVSFDAGTYYHDEHWHAEAEYLYKRYFPNQYAPVHAVDAFLCYTHSLQNRNSNRGNGLALSYLARYDYMSQQELTDAERHRLTAGITLHMVLYKQLYADLRLNYEQYWYASSPESASASASPKESEQSKLVAELMLHF